MSLTTPHVALAASAAPVSNMEDSKITSPLKAIRAKCLDCCCGQANEVRLCPAEQCALHPFRLGKNPYAPRRVLTEDERNVMAQRLSDYRKSHVLDVQKQV